MDPERAVGPIWSLAGQTFIRHLDALSKKNISMQSFAASIVVHDKKSLKERKAYGLVVAAFARMCTWVGSKCLPCLHEPALVPSRASLGFVEAHNNSAEHNCYAAIPRIDSDSCRADCANTT
jgi:hypothetical protein